MLTVSARPEQAKKKKPSHVSDNEKLEEGKGKRKKRQGKGKGNGDNKEAKRKAKRCSK